MSDDPKISARYRELAREEPPRYLDDAILAASRRAIETRPAPLVVPTGRRRWYFPLAAAAVIVLAVAVTLHVEREHPDPETTVAVVPEPAPREETQVMQAPPPAPAPGPAPARKPAPEQKQFVPDPKPQAAPAPASPPPADTTALAREEYERRTAAAEGARLQAEVERSKAERPAVAGARVEPEIAELPAERQRLRSAQQPDAARAESPRQASALAGLTYRSPEQWLQGIDDLKRQGRHEDAERELAEFRKRYPDYRIPAAILEKFEKR